MINKYLTYISIVKKNCRQVYLFYCCHILMQVEKILKNTGTEVINEFKSSEIEWVRLDLRSSRISSSHICKNHSFTEQNTTRK